MGKNKDVAPAFMPLIIWLSGRTYLKYLKLTD